MNQSRSGLLLAVALLVVAGAGGYLIMNRGAASPEQVSEMIEAAPGAAEASASPESPPAELRRSTPSGEAEALHEMAVSRLRRAADTPVTMGEQELQELLEAVRLGPDVTTRRKALEKLATQSGSPEVLVVTIEALDDPEPEVRVLAAWMLGEFGDRRALLALKKAAEDDRIESVRIAATQALRRLGEGGS